MKHTGYIEIGEFVMEWSVVLVLVFLVGLVMYTPFI